MIRSYLELEDRRLRLALFLLLLGLSFFGPQAALPGDLPAVRPEQILLLLLLPGLAGYARRHPRARRLGLIDVVFGLVVILTAISVLGAPVVDPDLGRSYHDVFDILRPIEYWLLYRFALIIPDDHGSGAAVVGLVAVAAIVSGALAIAQRYAGPGFNDAVTAIWTGATHNLDVVVRGGRAVGTIGNPNSFGIACAVLVLILFVATAAYRGPSRRWLVLIAAGLALAVAGGVISQSRSAAGGAIAAGAVATVLLWLARRDARALLRAVVIVVLAGGLTAVVLSRSPLTASGASIGQRFSLEALSDDTSVVVRLARLHVAFARPDPDVRRRLACDTGPPAAVQAGHEPQPTAGGAVGGDGSATDPAAAARDVIRKQNVAAIASRLTAAYCRDGAWPASLAAAWGAGSPPRDPSTDRPYLLELGPAGYTVGARLEVGGGPDGPIYALGNDPDLVVDPSFEADSGQWEAGPGTRSQLVAGGRFGDQALRIAGGPTAQVHQFVLYAFDPGATYTAQVWARSSSGQATVAHLVAVAWYTDGTDIAPIGGSSQPLAADGTWTPIQTTFSMPAHGQIWVVELFLEPGQDGGSVDFDGLSLTRGSIAPSFPALREVDPAILPSRSPAFWSSPVIGLGSLSSFDLGAFDNEYVRILVHFGILGLLAYVALLGAAAWTGIRAWRLRRDGWSGFLGLGLALGTLAILVYDVAAGVYFSYQLMAIYWLLLGAAVAGGPGPTAGLGGQDGSAAGEQGAFRAAVDDPIPPVAP